MKNMRYLPDVTTLRVRAGNCSGCGSCAEVCPHGVLEVENRRVYVVDRDGCMECGACATNCPTGAIEITPGVGCAAYILSGWIHGKENASCGPGCC
ncbi:MAG: mercury methylation ferredoxin HgcB [Desulfatibacillaceae bacterium]